VVQRVRTPELETISFSWLSGATTAIGHNSYLDRLALYPPGMSDMSLVVGFQGIMEAFRDLGRSIQIMAQDLAVFRRVRAGQPPSTEE
jgi:hypothetical protein